MFRKTKWMCAVMMSVMLLVLGACSSVSGDAIKETRNVQALVFLQEEGVVAKTLQVDLEKGSLVLDEKPVYELAAGSLQGERLFPAFMSAEQLVLREKPVQSSYANVKVSDTSPNVLYYEQYILTLDLEKSVGYLDGGDGKTKELSLLIEGKEAAFIPEAFFVDNEGKVALLGMAGADLADFGLVTQLYVEQDDKYTAEKALRYPTIWEDNGLDMGFFPQALAMNIRGDAELGKFLYSEARNLVTVSPYDGEVKVIVSEQAVRTAMPQLDPVRESYVFFQGFAYQDKLYIAYFPDYNNIAGDYLAYFDESGAYIGSLLVQEGLITLFGADNTQLTTLGDGTLLPLVYAP
jgi:hypothetical protein